MKSAVVDCSAVIDLLDSGGPAVFEQNADLEECILVAPHLLDPEFLSTVRRRAMRQRGSGEHYERFILSFYRLDIMRMEHDPLWEYVWRWREDLSAYDAMYVALAHVLEIPLLTADERLAAAAQPWCEVRLVRELAAA